MGMSCHIGWSITTDVVHLFLRDGLTLKVKWPWDVVPGNPSIHKTRPVTTIPTFFSTTVVTMNSTAKWQNTETIVSYYRGSSWRIIEDQCRVYGLRWLRKKTCYTEPLRRDWASSPKILPDISHYNKTYAAQICEKINATLPYSELIFVFRKSLESIVFSAQEHIEFIHDKYILHSDKGYWFGVTFDEYVGKYIVDTTKQPFDMISYPFISNVSQTKQVRITFIREGPWDSTKSHRRMSLSHDGMCIWFWYKMVYYRFSLQV